MPLTYKTVKFVPPGGFGKTSGGFGWYINWKFNPLPGEDGIIIQEMTLNGYWVTNPPNSQVTRIDSLGKATHYWEIWEVTNADEFGQLSISPSFRENPIYYNDEWGWPAEANTWGSVYWIGWAEFYPGKGLYDKVKKDLNFARSDKQFWDQVPGLAYSAADAEKLRGILDGARYYAAGPRRNIFDVWDGQGNTQILSFFGFFVHYSWPWVL